MAETQLISLIVTMAQKIKEESENPWKHHDYDGAVDDEAEENGLEDDERFEEFHNN